MQKVKSATLHVTIKTPNQPPIQANYDLSLSRWEVKDLTEEMVEELIELGAQMALDCERVLVLPTPSRFLN